VDTGELYTRLKEAYTSDNLHLISSRIIDLFKERNFDALRGIQKVVNEYTPCEDQKINRIFSRLIMLYHPDRLNQSLNRLENAYRDGDFEDLYAMSHILTVQHMETEGVGAGSILTEEDLAEEFGWDENTDGYSYITDDEAYGDEREEDFDFSGPTFLAAIKRRVYGNLNVDFPMYLLEDLEEIEMADYEIEFLDGIEACRYARVVDLSNNNLTDVTDLRELPEIERLYLANNHIGLIDPLSNLTGLQVLDISYNDVDDLSPLFELEQLAYLNVMGNRVPAWQLETLQLKGITIVA
jgi:hypothetical protein